MSNFANLSVTGITVPAPYDGFDEGMANAFLLLLRDGLGDLMTEWKADAFAFIRAQEGGMSKFFGTVEHKAAIKVVESGLSWFHFDDTISDLFMPQATESSDLSMLPVMESSVAATVFVAPEAGFDMPPVELVGVAYHSNNITEYAC